MPKSDQGAGRDRYMLIPRTLVFISRGEDVLLIKGAPEKRLWANRYNGIGGHVERGEDVISSARRELHEETGLVAQNLRLVGMVTVDTGEEVGIGIYIIRGEYEGGEPRESAEGTLVWAPLAQAGSYPLVEDLPVLLEKIFSHKQGDAPFSAHYAYDAYDRLVISFG